MAIYKIGQIRGGGGDQSDFISGDYTLIKSAYDFGNIMNDGTQGESYSFQDLAWKNNQTFSPEQSYYLSFKINQVKTPYYSMTTSDNLNFQILLTNEEQTKAQVLVENLSIPYFDNPNETHQIFYELLFSPELNIFDRIVFKMARGYEDYLVLGDGGVFTSATYHIKQKMIDEDNKNDSCEITIEQIEKDTFIEIDMDQSSLKKPEETEETEEIFTKLVLKVSNASKVNGTGRSQNDKTCGRRWLIGDDLNPNPNSIDTDNLNIKDLKCYQVNNLLNSSVVKVGVQTTPGTLIMVNNEPIRVGRSGIYEVNNDINIFSVGVAGSEGRIPQFLIDYAYYE